MLPMSRDCHNRSFNFNHSFLFILALNTRTCVIVLLVLARSKFNLDLIEIPGPYKLLMGSRSRVGASTIFHATLAPARRQDDSWWDSISRFTIFLFSSRISTCSGCDESNRVFQRERTHDVYNFDYNIIKYSTIIDSNAFICFIGDRWETESFAIGWELENAFTSQSYLFHLPSHWGSIVESLHILFHSPISGTLFPLDNWVTMYPAYSPPVHIRYFIVNDSLQDEC